MNRIPELRKKASLTQGGLADLIGVSQGCIGHYESGVRNPDITQAKKIKAAFNSVGIKCGIEDIFPDDCAQAS